MIHLTAVQLLEGYRKREISPVEVAQAVLKRIEQFNPRFNAFCLVSEKIIEDAKASEARWMAVSSQGYRPSFIAPQKRLATRRPTTVIPCLRRAI